MRETSLKDIFNHLRGQWTLERHIQLPEGNGLFTGTCEFIPMDGDCLVCNETGTLSLNGHISEAQRSYIYQYKNDRIVILYNDPHRQGDVLHELMFEQHGSEFIATHCHLCGQDTYDLTFTMIADRTIQMNYVVKGPHKDYAMQTSLTRQI